MIQLMHSCLQWTSEGVASQQLFKFSTTGFLIPALEFLLYLYTSVVIHPMHKGLRGKGGDPQIHCEITLQAYATTTAITTMFFWSSEDLFNIKSLQLGVNSSSLFWTGAENVQLLHSNRADTQVVAAVAVS